MKRPRRSGRLQRYGHAGGHLRDALLEALEYQHMQQDDWWKHIELDFTDDHHNRWWDACHTSVVFAGLSANCGTAPTLCRVYISTRSQIVIRREGT